MDIGHHFVQYYIYVIYPVTSEYQGLPENVQQ